MKKSIISFVFLLSAVFAFGQATNYLTYDYAFCDLLGKVKKVTVYCETSNDSWNFDYVFNRNGRLLSFAGQDAREYYVRDGKGRITSTFNDHTVWSWNDMQVVSEHFSCQGEENMYRYTYDGNGKRTGYFDENFMRHSYRYLEYDSHGNWILRTDGKEKETRVIVYF
ncbi:MAG: hypothetical protein MJZ74_03565 [Muribaculaceae bacterium]|nr:hypothetical protein [Muribaculaceae bacterium]